MIQVLKSSVFDKWLSRLKDRDGKARILARIKAIEDSEHFGDRRRVGDGIFELRFAFGRGYRVYYLHEGDTVVILLNGGDKDSQERDIGRAKEIAEDWRR